MTTQLAFAGIIPTGPFGGFNNPPQYTSAPKGPHGGYTTTTNKCKDCHAVHLATGSYRLTRANKRSDTCEYCHNNSNIAGVDVVLNEYGHGLNATETATSTVTAPDDTAPSYSIASDKWGCLECHSVHDNQTIKLADLSSTKLLKSNPNPGKTYSYYTPKVGDSTQTVSFWCSSCHNANFGSHKDPKQVVIGGTTQTVYGHDTSGTACTTDTSGYATNVNPDDGINAGPTCRQCHPSDGGTYPMSAGAPNMLKSGTQLTALDGTCVGCHNTNSLP